MILKAYAKINLHLQILDVLENGYHEINSINAKINLADDISLTYITQKKIITSYKGYSLIKNETFVENVVSAFYQKYHLPGGLHIQITKNIPVAAGLGGGSSDISTIINALIRKFDLQIDYSDLINFLLPYGTDIIYCLQDSIAKVSGIGEIVKPFDFDIPYDIIIINPKFSVSTKEIYQHWNKIKQTNKNPKTVLEMKNDLEKITEECYPKLKKIKEKMAILDFVKIQQTGSGPTIFGLVEKTKTADIYLQCIKLFPSYIVEPTTFLKEKKNE